MKTGSIVGMARCRSFWQSHRTLNASGRCAAMSLHGEIPLLARYSHLAKGTSRPITVLPADYPRFSVRAPSGNHLGTNLDTIRSPIQSGNSSSERRAVESLLHAYAYVLRISSLCGRLYP